MKFFVKMITIWNSPFLSFQDGQGRVARQGTIVGPPHVWMEAAVAMKRKVTDVHVPRHTLVRIVLSWWDATRMIMKCILC